MSSVSPRLGSRHPITSNCKTNAPRARQRIPIRYRNNEDNDGPNNVENEWLGYGIIGFNKTTGSAVEAIINGNLPTATVVGRIIEVYGSENYNDNYTLAVGDASDSTNSIGGIPTTTIKGKNSPGATWVRNTSATLKRFPPPNTYDNLGYNTNVVYMVFSARPTHGDDTFLKSGDTILITEHEANAESITGLGSGLFTITAHSFDTNPADRIEEPESS